MNLRGASRQTGGAAQSFGRNVSREPKYPYLGILMR